MKPPTEQQIQTALLDVVPHLSGWRLWRANAGAVPTKGGGRVKLAPAGTADLVGWRLMNDLTVSYAGDTVSFAAFVGVEVKTAKGRLRPSQAAWLDDVAADEGLAIVIYGTEGISDFVQWAKLPPAMHDLGQVREFGK